LYKPSSRLFGQFDRCLSEDIYKAALLSVVKAFMIYDSPFDAPFNSEATLSARLSEMDYPSSSTFGTYQFLS
jgi:hypothetical protein